ncbi:DUF2865 domain-containing protein [Fulvimarina endophytica]|nr:DUF2865 domain-containing protein [Fulvimarina endophytica]
MTDTTSRFLPRFLLAASVLAAGLVPMAPQPVAAQSFLQKMFGAPTAEHRRKIRQPVRKVIRKKQVRKRTVSRQAVSRSSSHSSARASHGAAASSHTYQTLCVRKADGYFFPISFSTTETYFDRDLEACEARCPGTDVDLYVHRVLREEPDQMVSHTSGRSYTDLPSAFLYKTAGIDETAAKACEIAPELDPVITVAENLGALPFQSAIPLPARRPDPFSAIAGLETAAVEPQTASAEPVVIRQVGPQFFPDQ